MKPALLARLLRLAARVTVASAGGFTPAEIRRLAADLAELAADLIADLADKD
jgi:hypothetical protein